MVDHIANMVDMRRTKQDELKGGGYGFPSGPEGPAYPYGLCVRLCEDELEKLGCSHEDFKNGDLVHIHAMAVVTSVSSNKGVGGEPHCCVELQITHIQEENEAKEDEEYEEDKDDNSVHSRLYSSDNYY